MLRFNPDYQKEVCQKEESCFFGDYPTLAQVRKAYGSESGAMWLIPQLYNLSEYCGCKEKLQGNTLEECASIIAIEFYFLKISELMLFFHRFKAGHYSRFYGSVDPLIITQSLHQFVEERNYAYMRHEQEEREKKEAESRRNAISYEEYLKRKSLTIQIK